jgi:hypothetical protein
VSALLPPIERQTKRRGDVVRIGGSVTVPRDESVMGDVVAVFGSADVDGEVTGDVTVVIGSLTLGADAVVRGDVTVVGGALHRAAGSQIEGSVNEVGRGERGRWQHWHGPALMFGSFMPRVGSLMGTLLRVTLLMLATFIVVAAGRHTTERIADHVGADPVRSGLAGLLAEVMFVPLLVMTIVVLAVSIVGSPLLVLVPFGVVLFFLVLLVGFAAVAYRIGGALTHRFGWNNGGAYAAVAVGVIAITAVTIAARLAGLAGGFFIGAPISAVGYLIEYAAWTVGLGASILTWLNMRQRRASAGGNLPAPASMPTTAPESGA